MAYAACTRAALGRSGALPAEQTFILNYLIGAARGQGQRLYCAFVDFRKAYDSVRHPHLWDRREAFGISQW